ncbi:Fic family protein [hydrothermal vent metagenome]|uniref:Fic family protein n=1 Tax=hydrothermal vent metagenome TaxID=652676 RepID=A0A1W1BUR2_9ZZZZ
MAQTIKKWIWEHKNYPNFSYDRERLSEKIKRVEFLRGLVSSVLAIANKDDLNELEITNLTNEIINTSQIEGEYLQRDSVRDSVAKAISQNYTSPEDMSTRHTDDLTALMLDSHRNNELLSIERLHGWHSALFTNSGGYKGVKKIHIAQFRDYDDMKVVENAFNRAGVIVKYLAPPHKLLNDDINSLIKYCNESDEDPYIKSALVHLWFVSIHPYDDGNGRISRAIADYVLSRDLKEEHKIYSMSTTIYAKRAQYYEMLDMATNLHKNRHFDFTNWIEWNVDIFISTLEKAHEDMLFIVQKAKFWDRCRMIKLTKGHTLFLSTLIDKLSKGDSGEFSNIDYREITNTIPMTAVRQINKLLDYGLVQRVEGKAGRSTSYRLLFDIDKMN